MKEIALLIILAGMTLVGLGIVILFFDKIPFLGQLPGDIKIEGRKTSFWFPVTTCILLSIVLTFVVNLILRLISK